MSKDNSLVWVEISRSALTHNLGIFRKLVGTKTLLAPTVKSNAYGHGLLECGQIFREAGANYLAVNNLCEARKLREAGDTGKIYIMGYTSLAELAEAVELNCELVVCNEETIEALGKIQNSKFKIQNLNARIHLKVETGTHRQGISPAEIPAFLKLVEKTPSVMLTGVSMHFANIEDTTDHNYAKYQLTEFAKISKIFERLGFKFQIPPARLRSGGNPKTQINPNFQNPNLVELRTNDYKLRTIVRHAANSAATLLWDTTHFEMVRPGIATYGMWPSEETFTSLATERKEKIILEPALTWKTRIAQIKTIPTNAKVGYGCTWTAPRETRLAILPIGYYDGYVRAYSDRASILIHGKRAPVIGRVCMNIVMIDVTEIPHVKLEDEVVLLGKSGDEEITAEEMGAWSGTINYEVTTRIRENLERKII